MNSLANFLVKNILNEDVKPITALFGGGFKPPTSGHLEVVKRAISNNPEIGKVIIYVGGKVRGGVTQDQAIEIWDKFYKDKIPKPVEILPSAAPVKDIYRYAKNNPEEDVYWVIGAREGREDDLKDIANRSISIDKYPNLQLKTTSTPDGGMSGTNARKAIVNNNFEEFEKYLPNDVDKNAIWDILTKQELNESSITIDMGKVNKALRKGIGHEKETDENIIAILDAHPQGNIPHPVFLDHYAKFDKYFGEEDDNRILDETGLEHLLVNVLKLPSEDIIVVMNDYQKGNKDLEDVKWFEKYDKIHQKDEEWNPVGGEKFDDLKDNPKSVNKYLSKNKKLHEADPKTGTGKKPKDPFGLNQFARELMQEEENFDTFDYPKHLKLYTKYMLDQGMDIRPLPKVKFVNDDVENSKEFLGKTAYYDPNRSQIVLYTLNRHPKDVMRSFSHEMIHHLQNIQDRLGDVSTTNTNQDDHINDLEKEANLLGTMTFRNWTDTLTEGVLKEIDNENQDLSPFDYDQDGNESRIGRDINNKKGWRRLGSKSSQNSALKKYLDKYTTGYKWTNPPKSKNFPQENEKMYKTPYIMYVHLLQTSEGKNNIIDALKGMIINEPDNTMKQVLQALILIFIGKEDQFKQLYTQYKDMIENNAKDDNGANPFSALKYAYKNFNDKEGIFKKFVRNGWSAGKFNLKENLKEGKYDKISNKISSDIFNYWKKDFESGKDSSRYFENEENDDLEIDIDANITFLPNSYQLRIDGGAEESTYESETAYLEVRFEVDPEMLPEFWEEISMNLKDVVRHEIEHMTQAGTFSAGGYKKVYKKVDGKWEETDEYEWQGKDFDEDQIFRDMIDMELLPKAEYFKLAKEIDANLQGMYFRAKKEKKQFKDIINNYLDAQDINAQEKEEILDLWRSKNKVLNLPKF